MWQAVTIDQFEIRDNEVIHTPTGARFTKYPNETELRHIYWGRAAEHLEFRKLDIFEMAKTLLARQVKG